MKNIKIRKNLNIKSIIIFVLIGALLIAGVGALAIGARSDTDNLSPLAFTRGSLDEQGKYVKDNTALYTKTAFECQGLKVEPDFESDLTYDVYLYDEDKAFLEAFKGLADTYSLGVNPLAAYARIVIHPAIPEDVDADEFEIKWHEVSTLANKLNVTFDKKQLDDYEVKYLPGAAIGTINATEVGEGKAALTEDGELTVKATEAIDADSIQGEYTLFIQPGSEAVEIYVVNGEDVYYVESVKCANGTSGNWTEIAFEVTLDKTMVKNLEADEYQIYVAAGESADWILYAND